MVANYNTKALYAAKLINMNAFLARILNAFIDELNDPHKHHLPRYVLIMLDKDLIYNAKVYDFGVSRTFEDTLKWLLVNINRCIEICKEDLKKKRKGTVSSTSEPQLIWLTILQHPVSNNRQIFVLTKKFNMILENVVSGDKCSHIMKISLDHANGHFDRNGELTPDGVTAFWRHVDAIMSDFDLGKTELTPSSQHSTQLSSHRSSSNRQHPSYHPLTNFTSHRDHYKWFKKSWRNL